jgi:hypothetical protein
MCSEQVDMNYVYNSVSVGHSLSNTRHTFKVTWFLSDDSSALHTVWNFYLVTYLLTYLLQEVESFLRS